MAPLMVEVEVHMTLLYIAGAVVSGALLVYLFAALLVPEKLQ